MKNLLHIGQIDILGAHHNFPSVFLFKITSTCDVISLTIGIVLIINVLSADSK